MSTTILNNNGLQTLSWQQITQNNMVNRVSKELTDGTKKIEDKYDSKDVWLEAQTTQMSNVKAGIKNAEIAVDNGEEGIKEIKDMLLELRILVGNYAESESKDKLRDDFDDLVDRMNRTADLYAPSFNPIGNVVSTDWTPNVISYEKDIASNRTELTGTYIGSDFYIEAEDGTLWINDPGASNVQQYTVFNTEDEALSEKGEGFTSTRSGLELLNYNEGTGAISVKVDPNGDTPQTVNGTLHLGGTGLMHEWFYDLDTEEGRANAIEALDRADALVVGSESNITGMKASIANDMSKVDKEMDTLQDKRSESMRDQLTETQTLQLQKQQEVKILQQTFQSLSQQQSVYSSIFKSVTKNPLLDIIS